MNPLQETINQIKEDEGLSLKPYFCPAGKLTIGTGRNLEAGGITKEEAEYLLNNDIKLVISELVKEDQKRHFKESIFIDQPEEIQGVLINMAFNLGIVGLLKFKKTLSLIAAKDYKKASEEMLRSKWAKQVGVRAERLSKVVLECLPDSENGNLHKALNATDREPLSTTGQKLFALAEKNVPPLPSGYLFKIFQSHSYSEQEKDLNKWLSNIGEIVITNMVQSETEKADGYTHILTILYRYTETSKPFFKHEKS